MRLLRQRMPSLAFTAGVIAVPATYGAPAAMSDGWPIAIPKKKAPDLICSIGATLKGSTAVTVDGAVVVLQGAAGGPQRLHR